MAVSRNVVRNRISRLRGQRGKELQESKGEKDQEKLKKKKKCELVETQMRKKCEKKWKQDWQQMNRIEKN